MNRLIRVAPESPLRYTKLGQLHFSLFFLSIFSLVQGWFSMLGLARDKLGNKEEGAGDTTL
jgi:hypothetical protein